MKTETIIVVLWLLVTPTLKAQKLRVSGGSQFPIKYDLGIEYEVIKPVSLNFNTGVLTRPYDKAILNILSAFGLEQGYTEMLENAFKFGFVSDAGVRVHFKKNYIGVYGQYIQLFAQDAPSDLVENYLGVNLNSYKKPGRFTGSNFEADVALKSNLFQGGILYGRRFPFKNNRCEIRAELAASKNLFSKSVFYLGDEENDQLSALINDELEPIYKDYAYLASLNIYFVWKFGKKRV